MSTIELDRESKFKQNPGVSLSDGTSIELLKKIDENTGVTSININSFNSYGDPMNPVLKLEYTNGKDQPKTLHTLHVFTFLSDEEEAKEYLVGMYAADNYAEDATPDNENMQIAQLKQITHFKQVKGAPSYYVIEPYYLKEDIEEQKNIRPELAQIFPNAVNWQKTLDTYLLSIKKGQPLQDTKLRTNPLIESAI